MLIKEKAFYVLFCLVLLLLIAFPSSKAQNDPQIYILPMEDTITQGTTSFLVRQIQKAEQERAEAIIIIMDTPGGLMDATLELSSALRNTPLPVIVYVTPRGAMAASAGAFLVLSADVAVMTPGTTIGAAQPVTIGPGGVAPAEDKTLQFLASHIRSLAREKNRPESIAEAFVRENLTLDAWEALEEGVVDFLANHQEDLLDQLHGYTLKKHDQEIILQTQNARLETPTMTLREQFQHSISDPQLAFLLLSLGVLGIYLGLNMPGTYVPEVLGALALVLGIYGTGLFSTNAAGILLLLMGLGLFIAELFTSGFGILGLGGAVAFFMGAILLPHEPLMAPDWYAAFRVTALGVALGLSLIFLVIIQRVLSSRRQPSSQDDLFHPPQEGLVIREVSPQGQVKARGEIWRARSRDGTTIAANKEVKILGQEGLVLIVEEKEKDPSI